jgi:hypothetical protein
MTLHRDPLLLTVLGASLGFRRKGSKWKISVHGIELVDTHAAGALSEMIQQADWGPRPSARGIAPTAGTDTGF